MFNQDDFDDDFDEDEEDGLDVDLGDTSTISVRFSEPDATDKIMIIIDNIKYRITEYADDPIDIYEYSNVMGMYQAIIQFIEHTIISGEISSLDTLKWDKVMTGFKSVLKLSRESNPILNQ